MPEGILHIVCVAASAEWSRVHDLPCLSKLTFAVYQAWKSCMGQYCMEGDQKIARSYSRGLRLDMWGLQGGNCEGLLSQLELFR